MTTIHIGQIDIRGTVYDITRVAGKIKLFAGYATLPVSKLRKAEREKLDKIINVFDL